MNLLEKIIANAQANPQKIVLPESEEERTLKAADLLVRDNIAKIILLGDKDNILTKAKELSLDNIKNCKFIYPPSHIKKAEYVDLLLELRKSKGLSYSEAVKLVEKPLYLASLLVVAKDADGEVAGAINTTGNVLKPALQIIKTKKGISSISGAFIMILNKKEYGENGVFVFADCAVIPNPTAQQLAEIAILSAQTAEEICGYKAKVAMLSFSTKGSANHESPKTVSRAFELAKEMCPTINIDGELQADAALVEIVGKLKSPNSTVAGHANVLVFPSLDAGNIGYKLVQRLAGADAIGPILQGLKYPVNDLSRGCSVEDIYNTVAITCNQAIANKKYMLKIIP